MATTRGTQLVPRRRGRGLVALARRIQAAALRGDDVECPCCGGRYRRFLGYGRPVRPGARCPGCGSLERHRAIWVYLRDVETIGGRDLAILEVAPDPILHEIRMAASGTYLSIDLESPLAMRQMNVTNLELPDAAFDMILCSHVLEHVPDDRAAMRELRRVLRPGGFAILQTPWDPARPTTDEDSAVADPIERTRRFGQADHVRAYGADLLDRLKQADWEVHLVDLASLLGDTDARRYGLAIDDPIILGRPAG